MTPDPNVISADRIAVKHAPAAPFRGQPRHNEAGRHAAGHTGPGYLEKRVVGLEDPVRVSMGFSSQVTSAIDVEDAVALRFDLALNGLVSTNRVGDLMPGELTFRIDWSRAGEEDGWHVLLEDRIEGIARREYPFSYTRPLPAPGPLVFRLWLRGGNSLSASLALKAIALLAQGPNRFGDGEVVVVRGEGPMDEALLERLKSWWAYAQSNEVLIRATLTREEEDAVSLIPYAVSLAKANGMPTLTPVEPVMIEAPTLQALREAGFEVRVVEAHPDLTGKEDSAAVPTEADIALLYEPERPEGEGWRLHHKGWMGEDGDFGAIWIRHATPDPAPAGEGESDGAEATTSAHRATLDLLAEIKADLANVQQVIVEKDELVTSLRSQVEALREENVTLRRSRPDPFLDGSMAEVLCFPRLRLLLILRIALLEAPIGREVNSTARACQLLGIAPPGVLPAEAASEPSGIRSDRLARRLASLNSFTTNWLLSLLEAGEEPVDRGTLANILDGLTRRVQGIQEAGKPPLSAGPAPG